MTRYFAIIIFLFFTLTLIAQDSLTSLKNDTLTQLLEKPIDNASGDTLIIINKVIIEQKPMNRFWDRILPIAGILLTSLTLIYVRINYRIDKIYGGWSNWKEYLRLKKELNNTKSDYYSFKNILEPIVNLNPLDFVEKVKDQGPGMFKYDNERLKNNISKAYENLDERLKVFVSGAYSNFFRSESHISHRTGQNDKFNDGREFFFTGEAQSLINSIRDRMDKYENKINGLISKIEDIKII